MQPKIFLNNIPNIQKKNQKFGAISQRAVILYLQIFKNIIFGFVLRFRVILLFDLQQNVQNFTFYFVLETSR